jgi:hypothetical protein
VVLTAISNTAQIKWAMLIVIMLEKATNSITLEGKSFSKPHIQVPATSRAVTQRNIEPTGQQKFRQVKEQLECF